MHNYFQHFKLLRKRLFFLIFLFALTRLFFYFNNYSNFSDIGFFELLKILFFGLRFDISALVYANLLFIILHIIPGEFKDSKKYQLFTKTLFVITSSLLLLANLADSEYFKFTKKRSSAYVLDLFGFSGIESDATRQLPEFITQYWYITLTWIILVYIVIKKYRKLDRRKFFYFKMTPKIIIKQSIWFLIISGIFIVFARGGFQLKPLRIINAASYTSPQNIPLILNTPFTIMKTLGSKKLPEKNYFEQNKLDNIYSPLVKYTSNSNFKKDNVIVIILESFSNEYIGAFNKGKGYTPFLDSLIKKSLTFSNAYANGTQSIEALPSVLSGLPALMDNPFITSDYSSNELNSIASLLREYNYETSIFHGLTNGSMGFDNFASVAQIEKYYGRSEYDNEDHYDGRWGIFDEEFSQYTAKELDKTKRPFFSCYMTLSSHNPYTVPENYKDRFTKGEDIHKVISYADFALKRFFETISKMPWYKNTLFVITADHTGPAFDEFHKNKVGRYSVPIIFHHPSDTTLQGLNDYTIVQQTDILPSIMDYLNYPKPLVCFGNSVFDKKSERFAVNYISGIYQIIKDDYSLQFDGEKTISLFDIKTDKLLKNNLIDKRDNTVLKLENILKAIIQSYNKRMNDNNLTRTKK